MGSQPLYGNFVFYYMLFVVMMGRQIPKMIDEMIMKK